jgi:hypothetical protein
MSHVDLFVVAALAVLAGALLAFPIPPGNSEILSGIVGALSGYLSRELVGK